MTIQKKKLSNRDQPALERLEERFGYHFENQSLLKEALTHPTFAHEHPERDLSDNQRLEFLGDAVLNLFVGLLLMEYYPKAREGDLTRMRATLVSERGLAGLARDLDIGTFIRLGKGELITNGHQKESILADAMEALMAAVYLDGGGQSAYDTINRLFTPLLGKLYSDPKTELQELAQRKFGMVPIYKVVEETGPDHDKTFAVELHINKLTASGTGKSKKMAEKNAAKQALEHLNEKAT